MKPAGCHWMMISRRFGLNEMNPALLRTTRQCKKMNKKLKERAKQLKIDIPAVFIALGRKETPLLAKILAGIAVFYALSPIDLIPDFIPVIGMLDDLIILPVLVAAAVKLIPADVFARCREEAAGMWAGGRPKKWYYAVPIVLIWLLVIVLIVAKVDHLLQNGNFILPVEVEANMW